MEVRIPKRNKHDLFFQAKQDDHPYKVDLEQEIPVSIADIKQGIPVEGFE